MLVPFSLTEIKMKHGLCCWKEAEDESYMLSQLMMLEEFGDTDANWQWINGRTVF